MLCISTPACLLCRRSPKMASGVDQSEFSGPGKRRKVEDDEFGPPAVLKILENDVGSSVAASVEDLEGNFLENMVRPGQNNMAD